MAGFEVIIYGRFWVITEGQYRTILEWIRGGRLETAAVTKEAKP